jgi:predicted enzyme related to lactoylglutathione lyase
MIRTIDHIQLAMPADKEEAAREFYSGLLQLTEIEKPEQLRVRGGVWFVLSDNRQIHLGVEADFRPNKKAHPCFVTDRYQELLARLTSAGCKIQHDAMNPPVMRFYTEDCFGNRIEIADQMSHQ